MQAEVEAEMEEEIQAQIEQEVREQLEKGRIHCLVWCAAGNGWQVDGAPLRLEDLEAGESERLQRLDLVRFQVGELEEANPSALEAENLRAERSVLRHASELGTELGTERVTEPGTEVGAELVAGRVAARGSGRGVSTGVAEAEGHRERAHAEEDAGTLCRVADIPAGNACRQE